MPERVATIIRFDGDPENLLQRFELARRSWVDAHEGYEPPVFYAICKTENETGIVVIFAWNTDADHEAFGKRMAVHLRSAGMGRPNHRERLPIANLGWTETSATAR
jgi:hypothetical protein